jgi:hypothetical protein
VVDLTTARLPHQSQGLAFFDIEANAIHGMHAPLVFSKMMPRMMGKCLTTDRLAIAFQVNSLSYAPIFNTIPTGYE